ncbi:MAG: VWA domain-containing protein [Steroidobacteraceae bacterium]|nr:VWA domain-containing protein [Steroidobacteraceae bacterium]MDW8258903.1 VWA domain-containing protein [Gammaproteobacteria bacterium]
MTRRRRTEVFSLSFLDVICCGFGAVVLFYTIITAQTGLERIRKTEDLTGEVRKLEEQVIEGTRNLVVLRNTLRKTESETASASSRATQLLETLQRQREESAVYESDSLARRERIERLKAELRQLEESNRRLSAAVTDEPPPIEQRLGGKVTEPRRYITGLVLKGRRILILLDTSASMLDSDLVEIIKLRNSSDAAKRAARKWRRALEIVDWIVAQIPAGRQYQVYGFNTKSTAILDGTQGRWLDASDANLQKQLMDKLDTLAPANGTSLINALLSARTLVPTPDQIILITDGLPTQGATPPALTRFITNTGRMRLFDEAVKSLGKMAPVDVVLMPMKGDNQAPHRFWGLARRTGGAFLMPSRDWP